MNDLSLMSWESEAEFAGLSDAGKNKVRARCAAVERILQSKPRGHAIQREAMNLGLCGSAMRRLVTLYVRAGGLWHSLVDWRGESHQDRNLPEPFLDFWKSLCEDNQRKNKPAWRELRRLYWSKATEYVSPKGAVFPLWPGYAERPAPSPSSKDDMPRGWSYANLSLPGNCPTKLELISNRQGMIAASDLLPMVFTSRVNLKPGQYYVFDDRWNDLKCVVPGRMTKPVRSIELSAGDVFSAKTVTWGLIPLVEDEDGKREQITGDYMRMLLVDLFCVKGFHKDGCTALVEHGTAAIPPALELVLCVLSGGEVRDGKIVRPGLIRVLRSGIQGGTSFAGGFPTLGKGNFRFKAGWESMHNLKHNELANLPGQTGRNSRLEVVEELDGREKHAVKLLMAATEARPETARILVTGTGFLPFSEFFWAFQRVLKQIEAYTDHDLEGWVAAGLVTSEYRLASDAPWQPMERMQHFDPAQREAIESFVMATPWATRTRKLSRGEAWARGQRELVRLPLHVAPQIFGEKMAVERTVNDALRFDFECADIGDDELRYEAVVETPSGAKSHLEPRRTYRTWINYLNPTILFVSTLEGNYLGFCKQLSSVDRADTEAIKRDQGRAAALKTEMVEPLYRRALRRNNAIARSNKQIVAAIEMPADSTIEDYATPDFTAMKGTDE